jgi:hypothetical protein
MIKSVLEKFDSPVVMINQVHDSEDWGIVASYVSQADTAEAQGDTRLAQAGWHLSVLQPSMDEVELEQVFSTPEAALEFAIEKIVSGSLGSPQPASDKWGNESANHPFGDYKSLV